MEQENKIQPHKTYVSTIENATAMQMTESTESIGAMIMEFRGQQVMIDRDLARLYGVTTGRLNEQVKRNIARFPESFRFQLTEFERDKVVAKCDNLQIIKYSPSLPYVFTEQGIAQLSSVLRPFEEKHYLRCRRRPKRRCLHPKWPCKYDGRFLCQQSLHQPCLATS